MTGTWAGGWATNDLVSAAEFAKGVGSVYDTTLGAGAASIDVSGIGGTYAHLLIVAYLRSDNAAFSSDVVLRFNGDSGANYESNGSTSSITHINNSMPAATHTAGVFGAYAMFIPHYAGTANYKPAIMLAFNNTSTTASAASILGGVWKNTAAVTRITVSAAAGNIVSGSRLTIYGMGA